MNPTLKTTILSLVSFVALALAGVAHAGEGAARRGQVNVQAAATRAVVAGPAAVSVSPHRMNTDPFDRNGGSREWIREHAKPSDARTRNRRDFVGTPRRRARPGRGVDDGAPRHLGGDRRPELHADVHLRAGP